MCVYFMGEDVILFGNIAEVSSFVHACEGDAVKKLTNEKFSYFNASIYLQNKTQIEKVDQIFGPINECATFSNSSVEAMSNLQLVEEDSGMRVESSDQELISDERLLLRLAIFNIYFVGQNYCDSYGE
ncbi:H/ACA snoRNP pseudouridylase subunit [Datura stramonium]|uniref:H/ACA ribonucleoprotein complex subunit n=1 Tax=Datura stramonium TaxID=4076 RepID=A0ABS8ULJ7_DATST|nr:H/ACA snoRNP pseudouridylase subunit [Datura stramonium]